MIGTVVANSPLPGTMPGLLSNSFVATANGESVDRVAGGKVALQQEGDHCKGNMPYRSMIDVTLILER